jgi:hypothetical protein
VQKLIDKCRRNYAGMTPVRQRNLRHALRALALAPVVLGVMCYEDGWRKTAGLVFFFLLLFLVMAIATAVAMGIKKLFGNGATGQTIGDWTGAALVLAFFAAAFLWLLQAWGH